MESRVNVQSNDQDADVKLHPLQYVAQVPYVLSLGFTPMTAFGFGGFLSRPYKEALELISPAMNVQWGNGTYHLVSHEAPFDYLRKVGNGYAVLGFGKELVKFTAASIPAGLVGYGFGQALQHFGDQIAASVNPSWQAVNFILKTPVVREPIISVVSMGSYMGTKALIERFFPSPAIPRESDPKLNIVQRLVPLLSMRTYNALAYTETLRLMLIAAGAEGVIHHRDFYALTILMDQVLLGTMHFAFVPHPIDDLVAKSYRRDISRQGYTPIVIDEDSDIEAAAPIDASLTVRAKAIGWYGMRTAAVLITGYLVNYLLSHFQEDKEALSMAERMSCMAAIYLAGMMIEQLIDHMPRVITSAQSRWAGLFADRQQPPPVVNARVEEIKNVLIV